ncbi:hypothetical protein WJU23_11385 [Prosthecobacter sp. SYSU 5D2]|uniref:hypothetical protein n=1 Tax=Prosthecobacter sp. SYSU 5D2 TaxID=3134134 RepID=UPI0031FE897A
MSTTAELIDKQVVLEGLRMRFPEADPYALGLAGIRALREQREDEGPDELLERVQQHLHLLEAHPNTKVFRSPQPAMA